MEPRYAGRRGEPSQQCLFYRFAGKVLTTAVIAGTALPAAASTLGSDYAQEASARMNPFSLAPLVATTMGACNTTAAGSGNVGNLASCTWNPSDIAAGRIAGPGELDEYTLHTRAGVTAPAPNQLPALRVQAGIAKEARLGQIAQVEARTSVMASNRSFLSWDTNVHITEALVSMRLTGLFSIVESIEISGNSTLRLDIRAQRGFLRNDGSFSPTLIPDVFPSISPLFGTLHGHSSLAFAGGAGGSYQLLASREAMTLPLSGVVNSAVEQLVSDPGCTSTGGAVIGGASNCSGWQSWPGSLEQTFEVVDRGLGMVQLPIDQRIRVRLGYDFMDNFLSNEPLLGDPGAAFGVLLEVSASVETWTLQEPYESRADVLAFGHGLMDGDFGSTMQVESMQLMQDGVEATTLARGILANNFQQAQDLSYVAAVPEPESWALLVAGLGIVACCARRRRTTGP